MARHVRFVLPVIHRYRHSCCLLRRFRDDFVGKQLALDARIGYFVPDYLPNRINIRTGKSGMDRKPEPTERQGKDCPLLSGTGTQIV